jgi:hypothetical protein
MWLTEFFKMTKYVFKVYFFTRAKARKISVISKDRSRAYESATKRALKIDSNLDTIELQSTINLI